MGQTPQEFQDTVKGWVESGWTPMRRQGTAEDIADVCALLCSDEARFCDGARDFSGWWKFTYECGFPVSASGPSVEGFSQVH